MMYDRRGFAVVPLSRAKIESVASAIRDSMRVSGPRFPIIRAVDLVLPKVDPEFELIVGTREEMGEALGLTYPSQKRILIREDVYDGARAGVGQHRFTIAHELGHLILGHDAGLARNMVRTNEIAPYKHSEWQADTFAGALLMPAEVVRSTSSVDELVEACSVSREAARVRRKVVLELSEK